MEVTQQATLSVLCAAGTQERWAQLSRWLKGPEIQCRQCKSAYELLYHAWSDAPDLVIFSSDMAGAPADEIIKLLHESHAALPVVLLVPTSRLETYLYLEAEGRVSVLAEDAYGRYAARLMRLVREQLKKTAVVPRLGHAAIAGVLTHAPTPLAVTDKLGRLMFVNDDFLHGLAGSESECLGQKLMTLCSKKSSQELKAVMQELALQGTFPEHRLQKLEINFSCAGEEQCWRPAVRLLEHDGDTWLIWNFQPVQKAVEVSNSAKIHLLRWAASILKADGKDIPLVLYHGLLGLAKAFSLDLFQIIPRIEALQIYEPFLMVPKTVDGAPVAMWDELMTALAESDGRLTVRADKREGLKAEVAWMKKHGLAVLGVRTLGNPRAPQGVMLAGKREGFVWEAVDDHQLDLMKDMVEGLLTHIRGIRQTSQWKQHVQKLRQDLHAAIGEDELTGLANLARFQEHLSREVRLAARLKHPLSLLMASVDGLASYESHHGKAAAEKCLRGFGATIDAVFQRAGDKAGRVAHGKFAVVLAGADAHLSLKEAERLRKAIGDLNISHSVNDEQSLVTVSVGVATLPAVPVSPKELWRQAEVAMGQAVAEGGNRVVHFLKMDV